MTEQEFLEKLNDLCQKSGYRLVARVPIKPGQSLKDALLDLPQTLEVPITIVQVADDN